MPEGPEVRVISEYLHRILRGKNLIEIKIDINSKFSKIPIKGFSQLEKMLPLSFLRVVSFGKKIVFFLDGEKFIISSLGLEGHWSIREGKNSNFQMIIKDTESKEVFSLYYDDSRHFGNIVISFSIDDVQHLFDDIGPDLLRREVSLEEWKSRLLVKKSKKIGLVLIDQSVFSGIGNYLRSDICYDAKINPNRIISTLSDDEFESLRLSSFKVMRNSYISGGFTLRTFYSPEGLEGKYQPLVYGRKTDEHGYPVEGQKFDDGRTVYWVPNVQK